MYNRHRVFLTRVVITLAPYFTRGIFAAPVQKMLHCMCMNAGRNALKSELYFQPHTSSITILKVIFKHWRQLAVEITLKQIILTQ